MVERFYSISHLLTAQLCEMYATYRAQGWTDSEYLIQNPAEEKLLATEGLINSIN
jgi:hypothetical protein